MWLQAHVDWLQLLGMTTDCSCLVWLLTAVAWYDHRLQLLGMTTDCSCSVWPQTAVAWYDHRLQLLGMTMITMPLWHRPARSSGRISSGSSCDYFSQQFQLFLYLHKVCVLQKSLRAHLHVVGMLQFISDINQPSLPTPFLFCSCVYFCLYGPFKCI